MEWRGPGCVNWGTAAVRHRRVTTIVVVVIHIFIYYYYDVSGHLKVTVGLLVQRKRRRTSPAALAAGRCVGAGSASHGQGHRVEPHQVVPELQPDAARGALPVLGYDDFGDVAGVLLTRGVWAHSSSVVYRSSRYMKATTSASCSMEPLSLSPNPPMGSQMVS